MTISLEQYKQMRRQGMTLEQIRQSQEQGGGISKLFKRTAPERAVREVGKGITTGVVKGALKTAQGLGQLGLRGAELVTGKEKGSLGSQETLFQDKERLETKTTSEKIGFGAERIAEFLIPSGGIAKISKGMGLLTRMGIESGTVGATTVIQEGGLTDEAKTGAIIGAMFPVVGKVAKAIRPKGAIRKGIGEKIQTSVIKPATRDIKDGFKIENINRFNLGGTLEETAIKTHTELNKRTKQLESLLKESTGKVSVKNVVDDTINSLRGEKETLKQFGNIKARDRAIKSLQEEIEASVGEGGTLGIMESTLLKRGAGQKGAWSYGNPDPDAKAIEKVYNEFYLKLKKAIEESAGSMGDEIQTINKEISELIPISHAVIRRMPIEQRNNVISLTDSIGLFSAIFDPRALALVGANRLSKSGKFGNFLVKLGEKAQQRAIQEPTTAIGKRFLGQ